MLKISNRFRKLLDKQAFHEILTEGAKQFGHLDKEYSEEDCENKRETLNISSMLPNILFLTSI
jgi:hypothetical protein